MLRYHKPTDVIRVIPRTYGRYSIDSYGLVIDNVNDEPLNKSEDWDTVVNLPNTIYGNKYTSLYLMAFTYKPVYIPDNRLEELSIVLIPSDPLNQYHPVNMVWKYGENGIESELYPGYRHIPAFSRYVVNENGHVISTFTGKPPTQAISSTGYLHSYCRRDDGKDRTGGAYVYVALAYCDYGDYSTKRTVDHIDCNKDNNHYTNLEWVSTGENTHRAWKHGLFQKGDKFRRVLVKALDSDKILEFEYPAQVATHFGVSNSSIFHHLNSNNPQPVFKGTHLIWYPDVRSEPRKEKLTQGKRFGSHKRTLLVKNVETGEITEHPNTTEFQRNSGLTRKQVFGNLDKGNQKRFGDIIFKYKDDSRPWVI